MKSPLTPKTDADFHGPVQMRLFYFFKEQVDIYYDHVPKGSVEPRHKHTLILSHSKTCKHAC